MNYVSNQDEVSRFSSSLSLSLSSRPSLDGIVTKVGEFLLDFNEEPDMSVLSPSILNEMNTGKDRLHPTKRPAQSMS